MPLKFVRTISIYSNILYQVTMFVSQIEGKRDVYRYLALAAHALRTLSGGNVVGREC